VQALELLGKRPEPDLRNAIKEAISAVESAAKLIGERRTGTLDDALESLARRMPIHPAMKEGFKKLYGFTSDSSGILQALLEEPTVTSAGARFHDHHLLGIRKLADQKGGREAS